MPRVFRSGLLTLLIVGPVLVLFLLHRGKNIYVQLPYFGNRTLDSKGDTVYHTVPPFSLENDRMYTSATFRGSVYVASFISIEPSPLSNRMIPNLRRVYEAFHTEPTFRMLSIGTDAPEHRPSILRDFQERNNIKGDHWICASGTKDMVRMLMGKQGYLISSKPSSDTTLLPSEYVALVDKSGHIRGQYNATDEKEIERLMDEIRLLYINYANAQSERKAAQ